ncbi:SUMF1/EgtB/PvdO family nonheme iron enzyme [Lentisphaera profundi]|uniref:SUMF1/EgtB/PvdO family nonheme iron enzyme n=1 Tax=Lentisphaera profundi TaxID=1658616 RepID=A0ABY7VZF1_9BACT|nr:SUMF1/EgtB/PvdO family nonheme iron enzyme [Lentisphaera profundi]WDE99316.1 SUMF1/EgtB/PvdO family nonheme iron enzyme [Lentisphaera profundi]
MIKKTSSSKLHFVYISFIFLSVHLPLFSQESFEGKENKLTGKQQEELKKINSLMTEVFPEGTSSKEGKEIIHASEKIDENKALPENKKYSLSAEMQSLLLKDMIWVEGGEFQMGSDDPDALPREGPVHTVSLDGFYIGKTEVTQAVFEELMGWNYSYNPGPENAVNHISWFNMQLFIKRLNHTTGKKFRLPTEAEWEYAAKGGQKSKNYTYSGSNNIDDVAWYAGNAKNKSHPVAKKKPNELGLYDMTGNLWEFCLDDMSRKAYTKEARNNPIMGDITKMDRPAMKVLRGGGYEFLADESEVYRRDGATNNVRLPDVGFRLAMSKE